MKPEMINWDVTPKECLTIRKIEERAARLGLRPTSVAMDITAVHANDAPLKLTKLLKSSDFDFAHDICGINLHLDRKTGKLQNLFIPRCCR